VPQPVEGDVAWNAVAVSAGVVPFAASPVDLIENRAFRGGEQQSRGPGWVLREVEQEFSGDEVGQWQGTYSGLCLGRGEDRCPGVASELSVHGDCARLPVDAVQCEAGDLGPALSGARGQDHHGTVVRADRGGHRYDLVRGERVQFGFGRGAQFDAAAGGAGDQFVVQGEGDDGFEGGAVDLPDGVG
jgi:hypothetical protein